MRRLILVLTLVFLLLFSVACADNGEVPVTGSQQDQVASGQAVYTRDCAECHDPGGIGPPLQAANLANYGTAQGLFDYTHSTMPLDAPGSLTDQEYYDVVAYMLSNTGQLPADTVVGPDTAPNISLTQ